MLAQQIHQRKSCFKPLDRKMDLCSVRPRTLSAAVRIRKSPRKFRIQARALCDPMRSCAMARVLDLADRRRFSQRCAGHLHPESAVAMFVVLVMRDVWAPAHTDLFASRGNTEGRAIW